MPQLSVVICSVDPDRARATCGSIAATSGLECEFVVVDNRERRWPIAKAYNHGASIAKAPCLFFCHEDILFDSTGWGEPVIRKLSEPGTGVIGFIGSRVRAGVYSGWSQGHRYTAGRCGSSRNGGARSWFGCPREDKFIPVATVDGMGMFVSRRVYDRNPFDEDVLTGFHCYDIDFCLGIAREYRNYVYCGVDVVHLSNGNFGEEWLRTTERLTDGKWRSLTPVSAMDVDVDWDDVSARAHSLFVKTLVKSRAIPLRKVREHIGIYMREARHNRRYVEMLPQIIWKFFTKRILRK